MAGKLILIDVNANNVAETGFFCYMSKRQTEGYRRKLQWLKARFAEGMRVKLLQLPERGFIEYIPGEYAWRAVNAEGYMFIHCLWVVGKSKGNGRATLLLDECIEDARKSAMNGVAVATSEGNWLIAKKLFLKHGFESVGQAPPSFELLVKKFGDAPDPSFVNDWDTRLRRYNNGLTIFRSDQCPYIDDAVNTMLEVATERGIESRVIELTSSDDVRKMAPSVYGLFNVVYNGKLLSYHYLLKDDFVKRLENSV